MSSRDLMINGKWDLVRGTPQRKSPLCQVWCLKVVKKLRYNVFVFFCDTTWTNVEKIMWLCKWKLLTRSHHPTKLVVTDFVEMEMLRFLFATWDHVTTWSSIIRLCGCESVILCHYCAKFDACKSCGSAYTMFLFCGTTSRDRIIKETFDLASGSSSP